MSRTNIVRQLNNFCFLLISVCFFIGVQSAYSQWFATDSFDSHYLGIKLELPGNWYVSHETSDPEDCFNDTGYDCGVSFRYDNYPEIPDYDDSLAYFDIYKKSFNGSLLDYVREDFGEYQKSLETNFRDYKFINDSETTIDGYPAIEVEFSYRDPTAYSSVTKFFEKKWLIYTKVNNTIYEFTYYNISTDYVYHIAALNQLLESIEFYPPSLNAIDSNTKKPSFLN